jgi:hypothetical protein
VDVRSILCHGIRRSLVCRRRALWFGIIGVRRSQSHSFCFHVSALKGKEKAWGPEHMSTVSTVNNLGAFYSDQGKLKEAEEMYQRALKGYEKLRGRDHLNTMAVADNLRRLLESRIRRKRNFISGRFSFVCGAAPGATPLGGYFGLAGKARNGP